MLTISLQIIDEGRNPRHETAMLGQGPAGPSSPEPHYIGPGEPLDALPDDAPLARTGRRLGLLAGLPTRNIFRLDE
ncbi:hypothetical protein ABI59_10330 [Acidobacteria bacterium Mor1]|nr:hypothetical protein ABI59_10330 [Acidobacteria bacterium Mor1]